ncbi:MAG: hypothetical protein IT433_13470 [Phycisphaerales bacterium]|nr:hypothetical protein [Phycisphaerales bacterium]
MSALLNPPVQLNKTTIVTVQDRLTPVSVASSDQNGTWTTNSSALSAASTYTHSVSAPDGSSAATNGRYVELNIEPCNRLLFKFAVNDSSDPNNMAVVGRLWLIDEVPIADNASELVAEYAGDLVITCGNTALATGSKLLRATGASKWADTIAFSPDRTYGGAQIVGGVAEDTAPGISVDFHGKRGYVLELSTVGGSADAILPLRRRI